MLRRETAGSPARTHAALAGLRAYQRAPRRPRPAAMPIVATAGRAVLRDYGGAGPLVLFVPSLINAPDVLDLSEGNSMLRWLAHNGIHPLLVDWGTPDARDRSMDITGHIEQLLLPLIATVGAPVALVGYCLGGTMALAAAASVSVAGLAMIASPWHFDAYPIDARHALATIWTQARPAAEALGLFPLEVLQVGFWQLDPARTISKFERIAMLDHDSVELANFVALEDWANDGPPLSYAAARELLTGFYRDNQSGSGDWYAPAISQLRCPVLQVTSATDRIVPAASAATIGTPVELQQGHVGMVVGSRARSSLWEPLRDWLLDPR